MINLPIPLENLIDKNAAYKLRSAGLHKVAAALLKLEGIDAGDALTMKTAVQVIGTKIREKNAEYARIHESLDALQKLTK